MDTPTFSRPDVLKILDEFNEVRRIHRALTVADIVGSMIFRLFLEALPGSASKVSMKRRQEIHGAVLIHFAEVAPDGLVAAEFLPPPPWTPDMGRILHKNWFRWKKSLPAWNCPKEERKRQEAQRALWKKVAPSDERADERAIRRAGRLLPAAMSRRGKGRPLEDGQDDPGCLVRELLVNTTAAGRRGFGPKFLYRDPTGTWRFYPKAIRDALVSAFCDRGMRDELNALAIAKKARDPRRDAETAELAQVVAEVAEAHGGDGEAFLWGVRNDASDSATARKHGIPRKRFRLVKSKIISEAQRRLAI